VTAAAPLLGVQTPRLYSVPEYASSAGQEAIELAAMAGLDLDEAQQFVLVNSLGERLDGKWAAFAVGLCEPRQNGKGGVIEARALTGLYLLPEPLLIYSAHLADTSLEAHRRLSNLIEGSDELSRRVKQISRAHGAEAIELYGPKGRRITGGQRIRFRTRTKGGGRGFSGACVFFDEAMIFPTVSHASILPILSAQPNPQAWYVGSAVDQEVHEDGYVFASIRDRGLRGDGRVAYFEWSADFESPDEVDEEAAADVENWALANPALGIRITAEHVRDELASLDPRSFAVERLGVGDWPDTANEGDVISLEQWDALTDEKSAVADPICFAFDVTPERSAATISAGCYREDGLGHIETIDHRRGVRWLLDRLVELVDRHQPAAVVCDGAGPAASLVDQLEERGITVTVTTAKDLANACGLIFDLVEEEGLRHRGTSDIRAAIRGAKTRTLGDAWAWSRKSSAVDISPLVAATLALWAASSASDPEPFAEIW
jgi:hypothetical protein